MNKQRLLTGLILAGVSVLAALVLMLSRHTAPALGGINEAPHMKTTPQTSLKKPADALQTGKPIPSAAGLPDTETPGEKAVEAWESLLSLVIEQKDAPAADQARRVKDAFDRLDKADQMDCIRQALNLIPDERFTVLITILYDRGEDPEVLDAIFSDALNRPEEIKMPLLKAIRKDREHPMFFESSRILDVVEGAAAAP
jgi:hypothetical protein